MILLEVELDETEVIASDFDGWHFVLNTQILDDDDNPTTISMLESWDRIFDLYYCKNLWGKSYNQTIQYTTGEIDTSKVKLVRRFICK